MATFVSAKKARRFPEVMKKFRKMGAAAFDKQVKNGAPYARVPPGGAAVSRQNAQVDVTAITGVAALKKSGRK